MTLLFFVSGIASFYSFKKRGVGDYVGERATKLMFPFLLGFLFLVFLRKLPENFLDENFKKDVGDFHKFIDKHGFKLKVDIEEMTSVFWILFMTLKDKDIVGDNYFRAFEFILDSTIENLFE